MIGLIVTLGALGLAPPPTVHNDVCATVAQQLRALKRQVPFEKWPGVEHELEVSPPMGPKDYGLGGKPGRYEQPVLQSQKARLMREVQAKAPEHLDEWKTYLASDTKDLDDRDEKNGPPEIYELKSAHLFRLEQGELATLLPYAVTYYYADSVGQMHVVAEKSVPSDREDADYYGYFQQLHFMGIDGASIEVMQTDIEDDSHSVAIWTWSPAAFRHLCDIDVHYDFSFVPLAKEGSHDHFAGAYEQFLAQHAANWARQFRQHRDDLDSFYRAFRSVSKRPTKINMDELTALREAAQQKIDDADNAYQNGLMVAFATRNPARAKEAQRLADAIKGPFDQSLRPVMIGGQVYVVALHQPYNGNGPLPGVVLDLYAMKDSKAEIIASIGTERRDGLLNSLKVKYLHKPPAD